MRISHHCLCSLKKNNHQLLTNYHHFQKVKPGEPIDFPFSQRTWIDLQCLALPSFSPTIPINQISALVSRENPQINGVVAVAHAATQPWNPFPKLTLCVGVCSLILWKSCAKSRWKLCRKFPISMRIVFDWPHPLVSTLGCSDLKTILFRRNGFSNKRIVSHLGRPGEGFLRRLVPRYTRSQGYFLPSSASSAPLEKDYTVDSRIERRKVMSFPALVRLYYHPASTVSWGSQTCLQEIRDCSSVTLDSRLSSNGKILFLCFNPFLERFPGRKLRNLVPLHCSRVPFTYFGLKALWEVLQLSKTGYFLKLRWKIDQDFWIYTFMKLLSYHYEESSTLSMKPPKPTSF